MKKELIESYMLAIEEEFEMMKGKSITSQVLKYLDELMHTYHKLERCMEEYGDKKWNENTPYEENDTSGYYCDESINLSDMAEHYKAYCHYKKEYEEGHKQSSLNMAHDELKHFLGSFVMMFEDIEEYSREDMDERETIKSHVKQVYQMFN